MGSVKHTKMYGLNLNNPCTLKCEQYEPVHTAQPKNQKAKSSSKEYRWVVSKYMMRDCIALPPALKQDLRYLLAPTTSFSEQIPHRSANWRQGTKKKRNKERLKMQSTCSRTPQAPQRQNRISRISPSQTNENKTILSTANSPSNISSAVRIPHRPAN